MGSTFKTAQKGHHKDYQTRHDRMHLGTAARLLPRSQRWAMGAQLYTIVQKLIEAKSTKNCTGLAALRRGGTTRSMWVLKRPFMGMRRGEKVLNRAKAEHMKSLGAEFRKVSYPADRHIRSALGDMAKVMAPIHHPDQFGFVPKRDCVQSAARHRYARTVFLIDIENAFDQITQREVEDMLRHVFLLNKVTAWEIAELACVDGHLYQGCPIAPVMFNIRAAWMVERLHRLCEANRCTLSVYADDVTISSERWEHFSASFRKTVLRIVAECGLKVNAGKCKVRRVSPRKIGHYDITGLTIDYDPDTGIPYVRPLHRRLVLKKADYLHRIQEQGVRFSNELSKTGELKELAMVEWGLREWAKRKGESGPMTQLTLP